MITEWLLNIVFRLVEGFFQLMPDISWTVDTAGFATFFGAVQAVTYMLPMGTVRIIIGLIIDFAIVRAVIAFIKMVWDLLPFA